MSQPRSQLTPDRIRALLNREVAVSSDSVPIDQGLADFQHLMEVYRVVRGGGVRVQIETAQYSLVRQQQQLQAEMTSTNPALLEQELADLQRATAWRIQQLQQIQPDEEAAVRACMTEIEVHLERWLDQSGESSSTSGHHQTAADETALS